MNKSIRNWLIISLIIGGFLSLFASSHPDGFETAGESVGFIEHAASYISSPLPDYSVPGLDSWISGSIAGLIGVGITFLLFLVLGKVIVRRK
ncbi:PDGLE domain-containing protein [Paenibacillus koleovorans]|uniref:PDGLE domain-containing protein n=1 Tax=Paenibacillus koleovorans TaxID=121608 RepID=UPI000FD994CD|nr:PDGLE domain-containing protein [Paenibacillus koleovorans]